MIESQKKALEEERQEWEDLQERAADFSLADLQEEHPLPEQKEKKKFGFNWRLAVGSLGLFWMGSVFLILAAMMLIGLGDLFTDPFVTIIAELMLAGMNFGIFKIMQALYRWMRKSEETVKKTTAPVRTAPRTPKSVYKVVRSGYNPQKNQVRVLMKELEDYGEFDPGDTYHYSDEELLANYPVGDKVYAHDPTDIEMELVSVGNDVRVEAFSPSGMRYLVGYIAIPDVEEIRQQMAAGAHFRLTVYGGYYREVAKDPSGREFIRQGYDDVYFRVFRTSVM